MAKVNGKDSAERIFNRLGGRIAKLEVSNALMETQLEETLAENAELQTQLEQLKRDNEKLNHELLGRTNRAEEGANTDGNNESADAEDHAQPDEE